MPSNAAPNLSIGSLLRYGLLGAPLAFAALPLYVLLPNHYATQYGVPLALLGTLLFVARLLDAVADPLIGRWIDALLAHGSRAALATAAGAALVFIAGFAALWLPPTLPLNGLLAWLALALTVTYLGYSFLTVLHQSWGAQLSGDGAVQSRITAFREGPALVGVLVASALPSYFGVQSLPVVFSALLVLGLALLATGPRANKATLTTEKANWRAALANAEFKRLCAVFVVNGIAAAVPATLLLFFVKDRLQLPDAGPFLLAYFACAALSLPLWVIATRRFGLERAWLAGMLLAIAMFVWAGFLGAGQALAFGLICAGSGFAAGADLALPSALVARTIARAGHSQQLEGTYFGAWNFLTKLNLALAAGLALPVLQYLGYTPGAQNDAALFALVVGYCWLPCALKCIASSLLWNLFIREEKTV